ncbi:MAG: peptide chain release factor N(5)-glutamine methyltransferase, partial [Alphaproteobacteria bacterium]
MPTLENTLRNAVRQLLACGVEAAMVEASALLFRATGATKLEVMLDGARPLTPDQTEHFQELLTRRLNHEPLAYILGEQDFWGLTFKVRPGVLIPRADTETLIATILALLPDK